MVGGRVSCEAMDGAGGAVPLLCPRFNFEKLILAIALAQQKRLLFSGFPYFIHSPLEVSHTRRMAGMFLRGSTDGRITSEDIQSSRLKVAALVW